ncbi:MDR family MFS transporter [Brevibacillus centrosporus]|nr:MFS transporter [Brevibacillus centrosporus]MEC2132071.1 MFS transporter [Brevibacillus centrosporus]MED4911467.1 MFS transporter [Brevibacillus centrosporus]
MSKIVRYITQRIQFSPKKEQVNDMARFHPIVWCMISGTFLSRSATYMTMPFLAIFLYKSKGIDADITGAIIGVSFLVGTFSSFLGGVWSDRYGRFPVLILSLLGWCLTFAGYAFADSITSFFLISALNGFFRNIFEPTSKALLSDITKPEDQLTVFNARYFAINAGAAIGPIAGVYLGSAESTAPFFITSSAYALFLMLVIILKATYPMTSANEGQKARIGFQQAFGVVLRDRVFRSFLIGTMFLTAAYAHMESTLVQYMGNAPGFINGVQLLSYLITTNTIAVVTLQVPLLRFARRFSSMACLQIGTVFFAVSLVGFGVFHSLIPLILSMVMFTIGELLCFVMAEMVIQEIAPEHLRGTYFGASGFQFIGQSMGPWFGGVLLTHFGFSQGPLVFSILMIMTLLAVPMFVAAQKEQVKVKTVHVNGGI